MPDDTAPSPLPPLVLLHGFTGSGAAWTDAILGGLRDAGRRVVAPDLPGHGRHAGEQDPARFTLEAVFGEIEAAAGTGRFDLGGYSMGGRLALAYAVRNPGRVRRLVLESASPGLATPKERAERREADEALARRIEDEGVQAFVSFWESLPLFASQAALAPRVRARHRALRLRNDPSSLAAALRGLGTGSLPSFWGDLLDPTPPVLLLAGALDPKFTGIACRMQETLPLATARIVEEAGHTVHLERPATWLEAVLRFLRG